MKCQSDYDKEEQALLRQADDCVREWWDPAGEEAAARAAELKAAEPPSAVAEEEAVRRGLLKRDEAGEVCLSCSAKTEPEGR